MRRWPSSVAQNFLEKSEEKVEKAEQTRAIDPTVKVAHNTVNAG